MKKATINTIINVLDTIDFADKQDIMEELLKEANRGAAKSAAVTADYDAAYRSVMDVLHSTYAPLTVAEIFEACSGLPEGFTKNKVSYGLTHYWADEVVKVEGKINTYRLR